jgi:hypothetical protein
MAINHRACKHLATNAERTACRKALAKMRAELAASVIHVGDAVMVWLDDAPSEMPATIAAIDGIKHTVKMTRSGNYYTAWPAMIRKI